MKNWEQVTEEEILAELQLKIEEALTARDYEFNYTLKERHARSKK